MKINKLNYSFLDWFVGFSEGDGCFVVRASGSNRFEIWQSSNNAQVLYFIKSQLGFGKVVFPAHLPDVCLFLVNKKEQLEVLKEIFADRICTDNTLTRYNTFYSTDLAFVKKPTFEQSWLSGFIDAEGCFRIKFDKNNTVKLIFEISQEDADLITNIRDLFCSLKDNIRLDRGVTTLSFSGDNPRKSLISYLKANPLKTQKRIVLAKWVKADRILENKQLYKESKLDWKAKIQKLSENLNKWRIKDRVRSSSREEESGVSNRNPAT